MMNCTLIIPAAGIGKRFGGKLPKQFTLLKEIPIIIRTIMCFELLSEINSIIVSVSEDWKEYTENLIAKYNLKKIKQVVIGGKERQDSVYNALYSEFAKKADIILIHDAVRPYPSENLIQRVINSTIEFDAVIPAMLPKETIKQVDDSGFVVKTIDRTSLRSIQTPQGFLRNVILKSYNIAMSKNFYATDDAALVEFAGYPVKVIEGEEGNIKITTMRDL